MCRIKPINIDVPLNYRTSLYKKEMVPDCHTVLEEVCNTYQETTFTKVERNLEVLRSTLG